MSAKRAADDGQVRPSPKRQKTLPEPAPDLKPEAEQGLAIDRFEDQIFRFMDLPGELRNRVYDFATEYAHRCFPPIYRTKKSKSRKTRSSSSPTTSATDSHVEISPKRLPYIGLTQASSLIRSEFRPAWLSTNKIPLCALDGYLKAFFPRPNPRASPEAQKRIQTQCNSSGSLRIWVRKDELDDVDITRLAKHATKFPEYTITFHSAPDVPATRLSAFQALVTNKNALWKKWIKANTISQLRLRMCDMPNQRIRVVIKEEQAPLWMKLGSSAHLSPFPEFLEKLGLADVHKEWGIGFGVDYS